jgi:hypothetical protein
VKLVKDVNLVKVDGEEFPANEMVRVVPGV